LMRGGHRYEAFAPECSENAASVTGGREEGKDKGGVGGERVHPIRFVQCSPRGEKEKGEYSNVQTSHASFLVGEKKEKGKSLQDPYQAYRVSLGRGRGGGRGEKSKTTGTNGV